MVRPNRKRRKEALVGTVISIVQKFGEIVHGPDLRFGARQNARVFLQAFVIIGVLAMIAPP